MSAEERGPEGGTFRPQAAPAGAGPPGPPEAERRDIRPGVGVLILVIVVVFLSTALLLIRWLGGHALGPDRPVSGRLVPPAATSIAPGTEHLQKDPIVDRVAADEDANRMLHSYEWVQGAPGRARIPIEVAMDLIATGAVRAPGPPPGTISPGPWKERQP